MYKKNNNKEKNYNLPQNMCLVILEFQVKSDDPITQSHREQHFTVVVFQGGANFKHSVIIFYKLTIPSECKILIRKETPAVK